MSPVRPTVEVIKDGPRQSLLGQRPEIPNTDNMRRRHRARRPAHRLFPDREPIRSMPAP